MSKTRQRFSMKPIAFALGSLIAANASAESLALEEVVVTAQKRAESLQDVPISVSAMSGEKMAEAGIQRFEDFTSYVPNFSVARDAIGDKINIRGIQSGTQAGFEQSVGTFVDGVYRGRSVQSRYAFLDTEMVEILRGPQGTLFGKNTIAGALNIRSAKPTDEFESEISAGYNVDFDETELQGYVSGPLTDTLRARAAFLTREMEEGWVENVADGNDLSDSDEKAGRISLEWDASENTLVSFKYEYADFEVVGMPWDLRDGGPQDAFLRALGDSGEDNYKTAMSNSAAVTQALGLGATDPNGVMDFGTNNLFEGTSQEAALTVEHDLSDGSTITAILAHSEYEFERFLDADFGPTNSLRFDDTEDFDQQSFEIRWASETGGEFETIAGFFYQQQDMTVDGLSYFHTDTLNQILAGGCGASNAGDIATALGGTGTGNPAADAQTGVGVGIGNGVTNAAQLNSCGLFGATLNAVANGVPGVQRYAIMEQESEAWAMFAQTTWNFREDMRLTLGLRYTEEEKEASQEVYTTEFGERNDTETNDALQVSLAQMAGEFTTHSYTTSDPGMKRDEESLTWSANLQWDVTPDAMVYASASTGFKAGGFNSFYMGSPNGGGADSNDVAFDEEEVITFEVGTKLTLLDGAAEMNVAVFHTEYDDLQASIFSGNTTFSVQNAAKATSQGVEIDGRWRATEKLTLTGSLGYVNFEFDEFSNQACTNSQFVDARQAAFDAATGLAGQIGAVLGYNNATCSAAGVNDLAGEVSENTPEWQATLTSNYVQPLGDFELVLNMDVNWLDERFTQGDLDPNNLEDDVLKVNASATFGPADGQWDVSLIGKNLTDETTSNWGNDTPLFSGSHDYAMEAPRSFTVRGRMRF
ncbi:TonB-dependent receptor [Maricurvus nonylphenolicus]|uniref:TonB-dependent receptor n=1 Tax=Maricurvus nonylphenolicus TaxID=1008307 RepID=UPI0036F41CE5